MEGQDTVVKNGLTHNIKTHIHCISAMRQYGDKSLEELHFEDYAAGRKGATATGLGTGLLGNQGIGLGLNANTGGGLFGQNKTIGGEGVSVSVTLMYTMYYFSKPVLVFRLRIHVCVCVCLCRSGRH